MALISKLTNNKGTSIFFLNVNISGQENVTYRLEL